MFFQEFLHDSLLYGPSVKVSTFSGKLIQQNFVFLPYNRVLMGNNGQELFFFVDVPRYSGSYNLSSHASFFHQGVNEGFF